MQTKKVVLPSTLISERTPGTEIGIAHWSLNIPNTENFDLRFKVAERGTVFYDNPPEGSLMIQEFWNKAMSQIYLDVNTEGDLIVVFPEGMDGYLNEKGELIVVE